LEADAASDDRAAPLQWNAQRLQLLGLQIELGLEILQGRRSRPVQVLEQRSPFGLAGHTRELGTADRICECKRRLAEEDRLAVVDAELVHIGPLGKLEVPRVLRRGPGTAPPPASGVGLLVAGLEEARQGRVRRSRQETAIGEELERLLRRFERTVRGEAAEGGAPLLGGVP